MAVVMVRGHAISIDHVEYVDEFYRDLTGGYAIVVFSSGAEKTIKWSGEENELARSEYQALVEAVGA